MTQREAHLLIAFALILWLLVGATGCAPGTGHLDPRKAGTTTVSIASNNDRVEFRREAPAPFWVENHWKVVVEHPETKATIRVEFNPNAERSATLFEKGISALCGFIGGLLSR